MSKVKQPCLTSKKLAKLHRGKPIFKVDLTKEEILFLMGTIRLAKVDAEKIQNLGSEYPDLKASAVDDLANLNAIHQKLSDAYGDQWTAANADKKE